MTIKSKVKSTVAKGKKILKDLEMKVTPISEMTLEQRSSIINQKIASLIAEYQVGLVPVVQFVDTRPPKVGSSTNEVPVA